MLSRETDRIDRAGVHVRHPDTIPRVHFSLTGAIRPEAAPIEEVQEQLPEGVILLAPEDQVVLPTHEAQDPLRVTEVQDALDPEVPDTAVPGAVLQEAQVTEVLQEEAPGVQVTEAQEVDRVLPVATEAPVVDHVLPVEGPVAEAAEEAEEEGLKTQLTVTSKFLI